ncbi:hypothetical protein B296_00054717 [Ensete ventricosum]|uniref:B box-type domain-containing protein n=1 Tax=Ensete ventricosum TaxID=4639 RepID=A0A426X2H0_ENSVE|nr:hypothetical protein B296_00054717 [Ensete ventricosum]
MGRREYGGGGMPGWLGALVEESFFVGCGTHENRRKNEKNIFCLGCCSSICPHCVPAHPSHPLLQFRNQEKIMHVRSQRIPQASQSSEFAYPGFLLGSGFGTANLFHRNGEDYCHLDQVRRYVYNDVVRLDDLEKLIDCSFVQVDHVLLQGEDLSSILFRFDESEFAFSHLENLGMDNSDPLDDDDDDGQITGGADLEGPMQNKVGSPSSHGGRGSSGTKKNKSSAGFFPQIVLDESTEISVLHPPPCGLLRTDSDLERRLHHLSTRQLFCPVAHINCRWRRWKLRAMFRFSNGASD